MNNNTNLFGFHIIYNILSENHRKAGLSLCEDEDFVYLFQNGECVAKWYSRAAYMKSIMEEADKLTYSGDAVSELISTGAIDFVRA